MTFIEIQENITKRFSKTKRLYFNTRNSSLYFNKTELLPNQQRNLKKLLKLIHDMADDYHNNDDLERRIIRYTQKNKGGNKKSKTYKIR
jgi:hypothetical protein